jgi:sialic acid synthase SpsE
MIILDLGSGNTCQNSIELACKMVKTVQDLNIPDCYMKWQLFKKAGDNIPLDLEVFERASRYAHIIGMPMGVSVFDEESLDVGIHSGDIKFVKLANNKDAHKLLDKVPSMDRVIISTDDPNFKVSRDKTDIVYCVSKYPADEKDYAKFGDKLKKGISDHTTNWNLFKKYQPKIYECHFCFEDSEGLDAGKFARRPKDFKEILNLAMTPEDILKEEYENSNN